MVACCDNIVCRFIWKWFTPIVRFWGVITATVVWIICIKHLEDGAFDFYSIYLMVVASFVSIFELVFFFEPCITKCCNPDGCCGKFWMIICWFDNWKRAIIYVCLSIACYMDTGHPKTIIAGVMIDILAIFYILRTYRVYSSNEAREHQPGQTTISGKTYGRFENDDLKNRDLRGVAEDPEIKSHDEDIENRYENGGNPFGEEKSKPKGGNGIGTGGNPFGGKFDDDDADPRGDAGLPSRYPP